MRHEGVRDIKQLLRVMRTGQESHSSSQAGDLGVLSNISHTDRHHQQERLTDTRAATEVTSGLEPKPAIKREQDVQQIEAHGQTRRQTYTLD